MTKQHLMVLGAATLLALGTQAVAFDEIPFEQLPQETVIERPTRALAYGHGAIWAVSGYDFVRIDASTSEEVKTDTKTVTWFRPIAISDTAVWLAHVKGNTLYKFDPKSAETQLEIPLEIAWAQTTMAFGDGAVWLLTVGQEKQVAQVLSAIEIDTGILRSALELPSQSYGVAFANDSVWVTSSTLHELYKVDISANEIVTTTPLGRRPGPVVFGQGSLWVHNQGDGTVQRIDPSSGSITATIETPLPSGDSITVFGGGFLWLTPVKGSPLIQIDPAANSVVRSYVGAKPTGLAYGDGSVWLSETSRILRLALPD